VGEDVDVVMVNVEDPGPLNEAGLKLAELPEGSPPALRLTPPLSDPEAERVTV
jgi:hypothetical protein